MWMKVILLVSSLVLASEGQSRATFQRGNDHSGRCQYTFTVDSPAEASCASANRGPEMENVKSRLTLLEVMVSRVLGGGGSGGRAMVDAQVVLERDQLQQDKEQLNRQVQELQRRVEELTVETGRLRDQPCPSAHGIPTLQDFSQNTDHGESRKTPRGNQYYSLVSRQHRSQGKSPALQAPVGSYPTFQLGNAAFQELKAEVSEVPAPHRVQESIQNHTGCGEVVSVGVPQTHRKADGISGKYGVWLQDPESPGVPYGPETVWRIDTVGKDIKQIFAYENMQQLVRGFPSKVVLLPEPVESTGATVYRGSLYYQRKRSRTLIRFDLASENLAARQDLPHAGFHGQYPYSWGGYTDIDLAVDEEGLWAIYSTSKAKGAIVIAKINPDTLQVLQTWETNIRKNTVANTFMVCGRLYTVASYSSPNTTLNYVYDTRTKESRAMAVPFQNRYRYNSMIDYNPANRKLYAWDNFHMVTYDVRLGRPGSV
ncbi:myocilin-like [Chanos chanos]|uniref:Myocilin n=1 Tax=Chanos chanos TaxID=29144 RepID=A0A6J2VHC4_CHACN|nr:myocilin-like [Chanos chanos]